MAYHIHRSDYNLRLHSFPVVAFLDATFDIVTCRIAVHHFPNPEQFVREARRVLKPGGAFLLIDNVVPSDPTLAEYVNTIEKLRDESHARCASIEEWTEWLGCAGFQVERSQSTRKTFEFATWMQRMARDESHVRRVEDYILSGAPAAREYCQVKVEDGRVVSWQGEQWMALCR
ncbi:MAG: methyltransferase domain-containing protein [Alicyclobacillus herbarius]|uniref:class I SAM-dependent methyltransferase n=1 Tax=Alicyclobacillus herbarius TaxID=122960 RepID=UPI0023575E49|nr:class I SAM-dependent methyltransferase [Alicyclobacillus herbarius]MCL6633930.1 methyltransferase domain-containing protein [Alicyclobacillus herbarius]